MPRHSTPETCLTINVLAFLRGSYGIGPSRCIPSTEKKGHLEADGNEPRSRGSKLTLFRAASVGTKRDRREIMVRGRFWQCFAVLRAKPGHVLI